MITPESQMPMLRARLWRQAQPLRRARLWRQARALPLAPYLPLMLALLLLLAGCGPRAEPLPQLGNAPDFTLTDQFGQPIAMGPDLRGKVLLVNFIYTRCTDTCPIQTARMAGLQRELIRSGIGPDQVRLISISVDPARDTPPVLREYAEGHGADPAGWHFLTGPAEEVRRVIVEGFKVAAEVPEPAGGAHGTGGGAGGTAGGAHGGTESHHDAAGLIAHSDRTVLVDAQGVIRAYYPGEPWEPGRIQADVESLLQR